MALPLQSAVAGDWGTDPLPGDYLCVACVDDEVSHERLSPIAHDRRELNMGGPIP